MAPSRISLKSVCKATEISFTVSTLEPDASLLGLFSSCKRSSSSLALAFQKQQYLYYFCLGRSNNNGCTLPYLNSDEIEVQIARHYSLIRLTKSEADQVRTEVHAYIKDNQADFTNEAKRQRLLLEQLEAEHAKLLQAYYAGVMPLETFGSEQSRIATAKQHATKTLATVEQGFDDVAVKLDQALDLMRNWREIYEEAPKQLKRRLNQAFFECVYIQESDELVTTNGSKLTSPFAGIMALSGRPGSGPLKTNRHIRKNQPVRSVPSNIPVFMPSVPKRNLWSSYAANFGTLTLVPSSKTLRLESALHPYPLALLQHQSDSQPALTTKNQIAGRRF